MSKQSDSVQKRLRDLAKRQKREEKKVKKEPEDKRELTSNDYFTYPGRPDLSAYPAVETQHDQPPMR